MSNTINVFYRPCLEPNGPSGLTLDDNAPERAYDDRSLYRGDHRFVGAYTIGTGKLSTTEENGFRRLWLDNTPVRLHGEDNNLWLVPGQRENPMKPVRLKMVKPGFEFIRE